VEACELRPVERLGEDDKWVELQSEKYSCDRKSRERLEQAKEDESVVETGEKEKTDVESLVVVAMEKTVVPPPDDRPAVKGTGMTKGESVTVGGWDVTGRGPLS
jgi:hypothetical protein